MINSFMSISVRKYRINLGENKQKFKKNCFFIKKKCVLAYFRA